MYILTTMFITKFEKTTKGKKYIEDGFDKANERRRELGLPSISEPDWENKLDDVVFDRPRTVGFFRTFREAEKVIKYNLGDISEINYYNAAVIEKVGFGLYPMPKKETWYLMESKIKGPVSSYEYKKLEKSPFPGFKCWY